MEEGKQKKSRKTDDEAEIGQRQFNSGLSFSSDVSGQALSGRWSRFPAWMTAGAAATTQAELAPRTTGDDKPTAGRSKSGLSGGGGDDAHAARDLNAQGPLLDGGNPLSLPLKALRLKDAAPPLLRGGAIPVRGTGHRAACELGMVHGGLVELVCVC